MSPPKSVNFGPIRLKPETLKVLRQAAIHRSAASIVREVIEAWAAAWVKRNGTTKAQNGP